MDIEKLFTIFELLRERTSQGESAYSTINSLRKKIKFSTKDACILLELNRDLKQRVLSPNVITYLMFRTRLSELDLSENAKKAAANFLLKPAKINSQKNNIRETAPDIQDLKIAKNDESLGLTANIFKAFDENLYGEIKSESSSLNLKDFTTYTYGPFVNEEEATAFFSQFQSIEWINIDNERPRPIPSTAISIASFLKRQIQ